MGQIIGSAAKPKRCNISQLSQLGTPPAAGEHILVSSDNSMNAAGQGDFSAYVVGNGNTAANLLPLHFIAERKICAFSYAGVGSVFYHYEIKAGVRYVVTNTGTNGTINVMSASTNASGNVVETFKNSLAKGASIEFIPTADAPWLQIYYAAAGSFTIERKDSIAGYIEDLENEVAELQERVSLIGVTMSASDVNIGSKFYEYELKAGTTYIVTNTGTRGTINVMSASANSSGHVVETFKNSLAIGASIEFTPATTAPYLQIYYAQAGSFKAEVKDSILERLDNLTEEVEADSEIVTGMESNFLHEETITPQWQTGCISSDDGQIVDNSAGRYCIIDIEGKNYAKIKAKITPFGSNFGYGFFLDDDTWVGVRTTSQEDVVIDVPENAVEFRFCFNINFFLTQDLQFVVLYDADYISEQLAGKVGKDDLTPFVDTVKLENYEQNGYCVSSEDGSLVANGSMPYAIIDLEGKYYTKIKFKTTIYGGNYGYGYFLSNNSWVGVHTTSNEVVEISLPKDAVEFRVCWQPNLVGSGQEIFVTGYLSASELHDEIDSARQNRLRYPFYPTWDLALVPEQQTETYTTSISEYYALWDALVTAYPQWVTKVDCSEAATALGITAPSYLDGCPIYMYKFIPKRDGASYGTTRSRLKVMLIGGVHSNEILDMFLLPRFFQMLNSIFATDYTARQLRTMVDFYVIPCLNPWGFVNRHNTIQGIAIPGRQNGNGVNLNRNFPTVNWVLSGASTDSDGNYSGQTAGSEYETKIAMYYAEQIMPDAFFDLHTGGMTAGGAYGSCEMHNNASEELFSLVIGMARNIINRWVIDNNNFPSSPETSAALFNANLSVVAGECHRWMFENITQVSILTEESIFQNWVNGVLQSTNQEYNTPRIWRENLQAMYNSIMFIVNAASERRFI